MKIKIYSIFDSAASAYIPPFYMQNDGLAIRAFQDNVNAKEENNISRHPEQFSLHRLGEFDDQTATITMDDVARCIARGHELINSNVPRYTDVDLEKLHKMFGESAIRLANVESLIKSFEKFMEVK